MLFWKRHLRACLGFGALLAVALIVLLWRRSQIPTQTASPVTPAVAAEATPSGAGPVRLAAMQDPTTYAATRLREIKADPLPWADLWTWRNEYAAANTPELQREVLGLAKQVGSESYLAVLNQALDSTDFLVRLDAARSLAQLPENQLQKGIAIGIRAADPEIRAEVMEVVAQALPKLRSELLRETLVSGTLDVQERSIELLTDQPSPEYFSVLLEGLRSPHAKMRAKVDEAIEQTVHRRFATYEEAIQWWVANRDSYDEMLLEDR